MLLIRLLRFMNRKRGGSRIRTCMSRSWAWQINLLSDPAVRFAYKVKDGVGFEPTVPVSGTSIFKTDALNHSATHPLYLSKTKAAKHLAVAAGVEPALALWKSATLPRPTQQLSHQGPMNFLKFPKTCNFFVMLIL